MIEKSDITLIGYTFKVEKIKDEFISKLPCIKLGKINSSFSIKSYLRDIKLNQILDGVGYFKYLVIDVSDIITTGSVDILIEKTKVIKNIIDTIKIDMYKSYPKSDDLGYDDPDSHTPIEFEIPYKLIIASPLYKSILSLDSSDLINNFMGGDPNYIYG